MARRGFTFVEMMVSVSIVVFAATLMLPTLKEARQTSNVAECMSNQKQLTEAFVSYSVSNGRKIIISHPAREYPVLEEEMQGFSSSSLPGSWMGGLGTPSTDRWALAGNSEEAITQGALFPYINDVTKFRCPNDWSNHERSYSASGFLNGEVDFGPSIPGPSTINTDPS